MPRKATYSQLDITNVRKCIFIIFPCLLHAVSNKLQITFFVLLCNSPSSALGKFGDNFQLCFQLFLCICQIPQFTLVTDMTQLSSYLPVYRTRLTLHRGLVIINVSFCLSTLRTVITEFISLSLAILITVLLEQCP